MPSDKQPTRIQQIWSAATADPTFAFWLMVIASALSVIISVLTSQPGYVAVFVIVGAMSTILAVQRTRDNYLTEIRTVDD